jgi:hypothetical protein
MSGHILLPGLFAVALIAATVGSLATTARAAPDPPHATPAQVGPADPHANCYCRGNGKQFPVGQTVCLRTPKGPRVATCGMSLNNTSWQMTDEPCGEISRRESGERSGS